MPEEIEAPTEHLHETIHEEAHKGGHGGLEGKWIQAVALSSALIAVLAAISSLLAGHHANEAMLEQIQASDQWSFFQAKGIKAAVLESQLTLLEALGKEVKPEERAKLGKYETERKEIEDIGHERERSSAAHMGRHNILARTVTIFQIAIAMAAISVLTRRRQLWYASVVLGLVGSGFLVQAII
jgi:Domain of unknown function (DUF4337)